MEIREEGFALKIEDMLEMGPLEEGSGMASLEEMQRSEKKELGRWNIHESERYLDVLANSKTGRNIIR
jgi:hypothetical protein